MAEVAFGVRFREAIKVHRRTIFSYRANSKENPSEHYDKADRKNRRHLPLGG
jgi:hypothetical protein